MTSVGVRNKLVEYFVQELNGLGKVIAVDNSPYAPALYVADRYYTVPRIDSPNYLEELMDICEKEKIDAIISLIDPELLLLSKNRSMFEDGGIRVLLPDYELVKLANDKYAMNEHLKNNGFNFIPSYKDIDSFLVDYQEDIIDFPLMIKPVDGSASVGLNVVNSLKELKNYENIENILIQKFMEGIELGADVYIDYITGEINSIFVKEKLKMRAGETDKSREYYDEKLEKLIHDFIDITPYRGMIDIDIFELNGEYYISEINPRFGGGYLHGHEVGFNNCTLIRHNLGDSVNRIYRINKGHSVMLKYPSVMVKK